MASDYNYYSADAVMLRKHGWKEYYTKPKGFCTLRFWKHSKHGKLMQKYAVELQRELNRLEKEKQHAINDVHSQEV